MEPTLKQRFMEAIVTGKLGKNNRQGGVIVSLREFRSYFSDVDFNYAGSFLPGAVIEQGQFSASHTRFVFRVGRGVYLVHPDAISEYLESRS